MPNGGHGPLYDCFLALFVPCVPGTLFSSIVFFVGGMFHMIQWFHVPNGASGSSMMSARLCVPSGMSSMFSAGLMFSPSQAYFDGIDPLCWNAGLVIFNCFTAFRLY